MEKIKKSTPNKWLKYDIMDFFGIRDISEVSTSIHRYSIKNSEECLYQVKDNMTKNPDCIYIIKLVYLEKVYQLPNYLLISFDDWKKCKADLTNKKLKQFSEIWYCRNVLNKSLLFGRMLFCLDELFPRGGVCQIEIVWGESARLIEEYPKLNTPFVRLTKSRSTNEWDISEVLYAGREHDELLKDVKNIITKIPRYYHQILNIGEWLRNCGCTWMSLEFSNTIYDKFHFIDWDTDNDLHAVKKWRKIWEKRRG